MQLGRDGMESLHGTVAALTILADDPIKPYGGIIRRLFQKKPIKAHTIYILSKTINTQFVSTRPTEKMYVFRGDGC
jgi:hypothetical protein